MSTVNEKMTALASQVRQLSGTTEYKTIDDMQLDVQDANEVISSQTDLIAEILTAISNLPDALPDTDEKGSADLVIDGAKVTAPAGYYPNGAEASVKTITAAFPVFDVSADEEESEIWLRAYNNQQEGYVGEASLFTDAFVKLTIDGSTAIMSCGDASIERTVEGGGGASVDTCTAIISCFSPANVSYTTIDDNGNICSASMSGRPYFQLTVVCGTHISIIGNTTTIGEESGTYLNNAERIIQKNWGAIFKITASAGGTASVNLVAN